MAGVTVNKTKMTHKQYDPNRRTLKRTRATVNGKPYNLRKVANRRRLVVRR